jgi:hypothetical protein
MASIRDFKPIYSMINTTNITHLFCRGSCGRSIGFVCDSSLLLAIRAASLASSYYSAHLRRITLDPSLLPRVVLSCPVGYTETSKESHDGIGLDYRLSDHNPNPNKRIPVRRRGRTSLGIIYHCINYGQ